MATEKVLHWRIVPKGAALPEKLSRILNHSLGLSRAGAATIEESDPYVRGILDGLSAAREEGAAELRDQLNEHRILELYADYPTS